MSKQLEKALPIKERRNALRLADSVKKSVKEIHDAAKEGRHVGRDADEFLSELLKEQS